MKTLSIDIETYSSVDLAKCGVYKYTEATDFDILLFGYSADGNPVQVVDLASGETIPPEVIAALTNDDVTKWAFNAQFERICLSRWLRDHGGFENAYYSIPEDTVGNYLDPASWKCTMIWSAYMGLPLSLEGVGAVLGLGKQKLTEGKELIKYFCQPCAPTKANVKVILTNITYTGNMLFQKEYCEDPITKHRRKNYGELPQYFVEDTHEAIIPMDEWQAVQAEFKRRRDLGPFGNKSLKLSAFSTKITCGCCGKHYRHSGKRNTAGEVYYIWTCQTKSQKGASACPSKNIPEKMLQNTTAEVLGLAEFDEDAFSQQIEEVIVIGDDTLIFRFYDGHEVTTKWQSTAKTDWWTDERRKLWGERHKRKDTNPNKHLFYEFTGFIKCGCCGANYRCQSGKRKDGTPTRSWYCTGPKDQCHNPGIRDETMKRLVTDVLGLDEFDEAAMDAQIENATILDHTVTFHFRDGHTESREFLDKRHGTPWTEERREKARESMKAAWTDERREAMSERIKKIRSEKKWPNP